MLRALSVSGIAAILKHRAPRDHASLAVKLKLKTDEGEEDTQRFTDFCERIVKLTGGIALFVRNALKGCLDCNADWGNMRQSTFEALLQDKFYTRSRGKWFSSWNASPQPSNCLLECK